MTTWYKAGGWEEDLIVPVEVIKETDKQITYMRPSYYNGAKPSESRVAKRSGYENFFSTWQEAHDFLLARARRSVEAAEDRLNSERADLAKIEALKP